MEFVFGNESFIRRLVKNTFVNASIPRVVTMDFNFPICFLFHNLRHQNLNTMKKLLFVAAIGSLALVACKKKGCTDPAAVNYSTEAAKDDGSCVYAPTITLNGQSTVSVEVGATYTDAGAVAANFDGSVVAVASDVSAVNTAQVGSYEVTYTASNEHGTTTATRTVNVVVGQGNWAGSWMVSSDCGTAFPLNSSPTITIGSGGDDIVIDGMFSISIPAIPIVLPNGLNIASDGTANATVDGQDITIGNQTYDVAGVGSITYSGVGTMNATGDEFTVNYTYDNTLPGIGGSGTCTATYVKQ